MPPTLEGMINNEIRPCRVAVAQADLDLRRRLARTRPAAQPGQVR